MLNSRHKRGPVLPITYRHQTFSSQFSYVPVQFAHMEKKLPGQKRPAGTELIEGPSCKKHGVMKAVDKWIVENNKALNTTTWLQYDRKDCKYVASVKFAMCICYQDQLCGVRNYTQCLTIQIFV